VTKPDPLLDALAQVAFKTTTALTEVAGDVGLTLPQLRVLGILRGRRVRMSDLAAYLALEKSSLSGLVDRAEGRGLVKRERSEADARAIEVFLTDRGEALARAIEHRAASAVDDLLGPLSQAERDALLGLLAKALSD